MSVRFVTGPAGSGKTEYILNTIIEESIKHPEEDYLYVVPEQFTLEAQRDIVTKHPNHGTMNIDAIGLNRLAYKVMDELNINPGKVLEDFGKSMMIKKIMLENQEELLVFGSYGDKMGFIDEMKSMMSELFLYDVGRGDIENVMSELEEDSPTLNKLHDIKLIYEKFEEKNSSNSYIVAEQLTQLLAQVAGDSAYIKNSHLYFDGFTGFTPVQMKLIEALMNTAKSLTFVFDADTGMNLLSPAKEYELFRLTKETVANIINLAAKNRVKLLEAKELQRAGEVPARFVKNQELAALETNLFRYPHGRFNGDVDKLKIVSAYKTADEASFVASEIRRLVRDEGYRYKDIAVVAGDLEKAARYYRHAMEEYDIPVFIDANVAIKGEPCSDTIRGFLSVMSDNFSYDSVFRFLKAGMTDIAQDDIEHLENYVLKRNLRGYGSWTKTFIVEEARDLEYIESLENIRLQFMALFDEECLGVYKPQRGNSKATVREYTEQLYKFLVSIDLCQKLENKKRELYEENKRDEGDACGRIFDKVVELFDKIVAILGDERITVREYMDVLDSGMADMAVGIVPPTIDRVVVGDMTRSRLNHVKVLFFTGVNDGIIPKPAKKGKILGESDRGILEQKGVTLAPSNTTNAYIEQFYIYTNLTKPSDKLYLVYRRSGEDGKETKPSYLIDRIKNIFPKIREYSFDLSSMYPETREGALRYIIASQNSGRGKANSKALGELLEKEGNRRDVEAIQKGEKYENTVDTLSGETLDLIYGKNIGLSVSRLESYAQCQFKYFLTYGLGLREREKYEVNPANVGNILHGTMRDMFDYVKTFKDNDWNSLSEEDITEKTRNFLRAEAKNEADTYFDDTNRATYKLELLSDMAVRTIKTLREFICCGGMKPEQFEIKFDTAKDGIKDYIFELPNGMNMSLKGIIDRVDVAVKENDVYYKIVDYKSSGRTLRTEEIIAGLALQLITYGAVFLNGGEKYVPKDYFLESDGEEKNAHLAALNYYEFKNAIVAGDETTDRVRYKDGEPGFEICEEPDYVESEILKDSRYTGLNLKDTTAREIMDADGKTIKARSDIEEAELKILMDFNRENLRELGEHMAKGEIEIKPMLNGGESACKYCNFRGICNFDNRFGGNTYGHVDENKLKKFLNFQEIFAKKEQILKDIKKLEKEKASLETKVEKAQEALTKAKDKVEEKGEKATANMKETLVKKQSAYDEAMEKLQEKINTLAEKKQRLSETGNL